MKKLINLIALMVLAVAGAQAGDITITLDNPDQTGSEGQTLNFFGTITNTDPDLTDPAIYLNESSPDLVLPVDAEFEDNFFANFPTAASAALEPGGSTGDIDLFDILLANPETDLFGLYTGSSYTLLGGMDGGTGNAQDSLATANFSVDVVSPEPGTFALLGIALALTAFLYRPLRTE